MNYFHIVNKYVLGCCCPIWSLHSFLIEIYSLIVGYSEVSGDREVQRTMLELLNQLDGFSSDDRIKVCLSLFVVYSLFLQLWFTWELLVDVSAFLLSGHLLLRECLLYFGNLTNFIVFTNFIDLIAGDSSNKSCWHPRPCSYAFWSVGS